MSLRIFKNLSASRDIDEMNLWPSKAFLRSKVHELNSLNNTGSDNGDEMIYIPEYDQQN